MLTMLLLAQSSMILPKQSRRRRRRRAAYLKRVSGMPSGRNKVAMSTVRRRGRKLFISLDVPTTASLDHNTWKVHFGAPRIFYVMSIPDGVSWLERMFGGSSRGTGGRLWRYKRFYGNLFIPKVETASTLSLPSGRKVDFGAPRIFYLFFTAKLVVPGLFLRPLHTTHTSHSYPFCWRGIVNRLAHHHGVFLASKSSLNARGS